MKNYEEKIKLAGLTQVQSKIYFALLKRRKATVKEIAEESGYHRTNIYDVLDELIEKGLITYYKEGKSTFYSPSDPKRLIDIIDEQKQTISEILPDLQNLLKETAEPVSVQVYRGEKGIKSAFLNIIRRKSTILYGLNIQGQLRDQLPIFADQFYRLLKENKIRYKGIYTKQYGLKIKSHDIRYISKGYLTPVATHIYKNIVLIETWHPFLFAIEIKSQQIANAYINYFKLIWKNQSKNLPEIRIKNTDEN
ncbi:helix-turn-helix domain-containing protein [Candidatus Pacearchaeota archaeon]|nr:helix-turn-helix domain-containing protein [Candidatus Pacearchaeota archaeon]